MVIKTKVLTFALILFAAVSAAACGAQSSKDEKQEKENTAATRTKAAEEDGAVSETVSYDDILEHCTEILTSEDPYELETEDDPFTALFEISSAGTPDEALKNVGYAIRDLDGNGTDELMIGAMYDDALDGDSYANQIYDIFTMDGDSVRLLLQGWSRNRYYAAQDDNYFNEGSGGASSSLFGEFHFDTVDHSTEMVWDVCYFTEYDDTDGKVHIYMNQTGSWDKTASKEQDMNEEEFWQKQSSFEQNAIHTELESLECYAMPISVCRLEDYSEGAGGCTWVTLDQSAYQSHLVLQAKEKVTDVQIYRLTVADIDEDGNVRFDAEVLYEQDELPESLPLGLDLTFEGDIPSYGISCVDTDGQQHQYAIGESGMDGSVYLSSIRI